MKSYILPLVFFIAMMGLTWYLFFWLDVFEGVEKRLTGIVTVLGLSLGLFQFWMREINNQKRAEFSLKYEAYKEFHNISDSIFHTLNHELITNESDAHGVLSKVINLVNQFKSSIQVNSDLFLMVLQNERKQQK